MIKEKVKTKESQKVERTLGKQRANSTKEKASPFPKTLAKAKDSESGAAIVEEMVISVMNVGT